MLGEGRKIKKSGVLFHSLLYLFVSRENKRIKCVDVMSEMI